jgi:hypothetical protein
MGLMRPGAAHSDDLPDFHPLTELRDWKNGQKFYLADALTGVIAWGATGGGKSSGPGAHLGLAYLAADFSGIVLCAKKEERRQWEKWAPSVGRTADLRIIDQSGKWRFNFLDAEAARAGEGAGLAINIVSLLDEIAGAMGSGKGEGGGDNKWFEDALHHMNMNLVQLPLLAGLQVSLTLLRSIVNSAPTTLDESKSEAWQKGACAAILREADSATAGADEDTRAEFEECQSYWTHEWPTLSDKTRSIVQLSFSMLVQPLLMRPLRRLFCADTNITPEEVFEKGLIIIVDLPVQEFRLAGRIANLIWKYCMQVAIMRRTPPTDGSYLRPCFIWADECQNFVSRFDTEYQAVARSAGGCTVYLTQTREALRRVLGDSDTVDSLLANLQAKFFCQNTGDTNEWASKSVFGEHWEDVTGSTQGGSAEGATTHGTTTSEQLRRYVDPSWFARLKRGGPKYDYVIECIVYNGGTLYPDPKTRGKFVPYKVLVFNQR